MSNLSEHITYEEATFSEAAIRHKIANVPNEDTLESMKEVALNCFEPLRKLYGKPIRINSFYRCKELNALIKGSATSQHCKGEAIDMSGGSKEENKKLFELAKANLNFDQLINEYDFSWVHISFRADRNRKQVLVIT